jgi:hypothetical protein
MKHASVQALRATMVLMVMMMPATAPAQQQQYFALGIGNTSCAFWQADARRTNEGIAYAQGVFTGLNMMGSGFVGKSTDLMGVVAELKKTCGERPSLAFIDAIFATYARLAKDTP